jgi:hypothetical protein
MHLMMYLKIKKHNKLFKIIYNKKNIKIYQNLDMSIHLIVIKIIKKEKFMRTQKNLIKTSLFNNKRLIKCQINVLFKKRFLIHKFSKIKIKNFKKTLLNFQEY